MLIAGLGNPGPEYRGTWHNLGFRAVEKFAALHNLNFIPGKGEFLYTEKFIAGRKIFILKPTSYMNLSGRPILSFVENYDIYNDNVIIVCDDINLPLSRIRIKSKGSDGGHNGLESIIYHLGTENFPRIRMGIETGENRDDLKNYVLSEIPEKLSEEVDEMLNRTAEALDCLVQYGLEKAMGDYNRKEEPSEIK